VKGRAEKLFQGTNRVATAFANLYCNSNCTRKLYSFVSPCCLHRSTVCSVQP